MAALAASNAADMAISKPIAATLVMGFEIMASSFCFAASSARWAGGARDNGRTQRNAPTSRIISPRFAVWYGGRAWRPRNTGTPTAQREPDYSLENAHIYQAFSIQIAKVAVETKYFPQVACFLGADHRFRNVRSGPSQAPIFVRLRTALSILRRRKNSRPRMAAKLTGFER
jgi:hypothetical protein